MNIKNKQLTLTKLIVLTLSTSLLLITIISSQKAAAQASNTDPVLAECIKIPKVNVDTCEYAANRAKNKASHNCEESKTVNKCIEEKAKGYISDAAKGNPGNQRFKENLNEILSKENGSPDKFSDKANKQAAAQASPSGSKPFFSPEFDSNNGRCGNEKSGTSVETSFNFGCLGNRGPDGMGPIEDVLYAIIRFLSLGVGIVIIGSIIIAGIQYSTSEGNPETTQASKNRIRSAFIGLVIYIFAFSLIQYLVPGGAFR